MKEFRKSVKIWRDRHEYGSGGFRGGAAAPPLASFRKIQGLPISKIVRTADSMIIIIITNFTLQL